MSAEKQNSKAEDNNKPNTNDEILSQVNDRIRNPLAVVAIATQLLESMEETTQKQRELLQMIIEAKEQMVKRMDLINEEYSERLAAQNNYISMTDPN